jgi:chitodextrinase
MNYIENARKLRTIIEQAAQSLPDETALEAVELYPKWESGVFYDAGLKVRYEDVLYTVLTAHMTQSDWTPDAAPSLFAKVLIPDPGVIPAWEQPDSTNAYSKGDKVTHKGKTWISTVDNNVWEPGVYGWDEI